MSDNDADHDKTEADNASSVLTGWWRAATVIAGVWMRPPLVLANVAPAKPAPGEIARNARGFPLVGLAIGVSAALVFLFARALNLDMTIAAIIAVGLTAYAGGTIGESGLARVADALIAGTDKSETLATMRRRSFGAYGVTVLVLIFMLKVVCIAVLPGTAAAIGALIAASVVGRAAMPVMMRLMTPARDHGLGAEAGKPGETETLLSVALGAAVALLALGPIAGIVALAIAAIGVAKFYYLGNRFVGGVTGALLGAASQAAEIGVLLAAAAIL